MSFTRIVIAATVLLLFAGCDQNAFTEDFPDPGTEGLPPYVAFDAQTFNARGYTLAEGGTVATFVRGPAANVQLPVRLPMALGETVSVNFQITGDAVFGQDFTMEIPVTGPEGGEVLEAYDGAGSGTFHIVYDIEDTNSYFTNLRVRLLATPSGEVCTAPERDLIITLTSASVPSGRELMMGRMPGQRDSRLIMQLRRPATC